jgi:hypothetical protein
MFRDFARIWFLYHSPFGDYRGDVFGGRNIECGVIKLNAIWRDLPALSEPRASRRVETAAKPNLIGWSLLDRDVFTGFGV